MMNASKEVFIKSFILVVNKDGLVDRISEPSSAGLQRIDSSEVKEKINFEFYVSLRDDRLVIDNIVNAHYIVGDDQDELMDKVKNLSNGVIVTPDHTGKKYSVYTSIVGLPPVFIYDCSEFLCLTTDIYLLLFIHNLSLEFDPKGLLDLCRVGHTTNRKTLYNNVEMAEPGCLYEIDGWTNLSHTRTWIPPEESKSYRWEDFCEEQLALFDNSITRLNTENTFLSLTAGLDTRAILSGLIKHKKKLPSSYTVSGPASCLDSRTASALSGHYDFQHNIIRLDSYFLEQLERYMLAASKFSGGGHSWGQAHEVYFYERIGDSYSGRISGNLGNQIGRGGTEGVSVRNADVSVFKKEFLESIVDHKYEEHWLSITNNSTYRDRYMGLLSDEIPHSLVGNYCIGNNFLTQKTPYANRELIELTFYKPLEKFPDSIHLIKVHDLKHRFLGQEVEKSFQRKYISQNGGFAAEYPINWGWRASGGFSLLGCIEGLLCLADVLQSKSNLNIIKKISDRLKISGQHVYVLPESWMNSRVKNDIVDIVLSECDMPIFDRHYVELILYEYFEKSITSHWATISFLIDFSFAKRVFVNK